ncbi:DUF2076 domain-containing protein [Bradyrhizobium sp. LjRoot220]|uniref:DUF2076 domain-containing protein n=1 Tax=Bradyrhizobium sp. LjRoot220 TaxID=3342284 RepID=UPI003ECF6843
MTPQERQLIDDLFDRLAKLENAPRDAEAMSAIMQGLRSAPNAVYALVQTTLVQDEALKRANDRIQQLEGGHAGEQNQPGGFLDSMRDAIFGQNQSSQGSVPNVRAPGMGGRPVWNSGQVMQQTQGPGQGQYGQPGYGQPAYGQPAQQQPPFGGGGGGSFLGTAAAAAAGVVGGSMLLGSIRSMMGGGGNQQAAFGGDTGGHRGSVEDRRPGGSDQSGGDLAREAGVNDIGSSGSSRTGLLDNNEGGDSSRSGYFDNANDDNYDDMDHDSDGFDGDGGGDD